MMKDGLVWFMASLTQTADLEKNGCSAMYVSYGRMKIASRGIQCVFARTVIRTTNAIKDMVLLLDRQPARPELECCMLFFNNYPLSMSTFLA